MGSILVHEFMSLRRGDRRGAIWTAELRLRPRDGGAYRRPRPTAGRGILLGRTTFEMFAPAWSSADD